MLLLYKNHINKTTKNSLIIIIFKILCNILNSNIPKNMVTPSHLM